MSGQRDDAASAQILRFRLGNADFEVTRSVWSVDDLKLDPTNPRLGYTLRAQKKGPTASDKDLQKIIWELDSVKALYQSVLQNGGLLEDPVVRMDGTVVEGNCRTVVLRQIRQKYPNDERFKKVYVRVLPANVTEEQISLLLGELHIAGKIEWSAFDQAEYVWKMNKVFGKTYDFLATHLRWSRSKLYQKIMAYEETKAYLERTGDQLGNKRFSFFEEFMKKKPLRERREQDASFMEQFGKWIQDGKLTDSREVRDLPGILENEEAFKKFQADSLKAARQILQAADPSLTSNLYAAIDQATNELSTIALNEITDLEEGNDVKLEKLQKLAKALKRIEEKAKVEILGS
jgi:hypothetical protein